MAWTDVGRSGIILGSRVQKGVAPEKEPTGGENGKGERGATSLPLPSPRAGAVCGRTSAHAGGAVVMQGCTLRRVTRRHPAMRDRRTPHRNGPVVRQGAAEAARAGPKASNAAGSFQ